MCIMRIMWGWVCVVMLFIPVMLKCQTSAVGARSISLGGISSGLEDARAVENNPAGLGRYDHLSLATSLEQRFLMKETGYYSLAVTMPGGHGCGGISYLSSGYGSFLEQKISFGYGRLFGKNVLAGLSLAYIFRKSGNESRPTHLASYSLGTIIILNDRLNLAFATFNPFQYYYKSMKYATLASVFKLGFSYRYNQALVIHSELEKNLDYPFIYRIGTEYSIKEIFILRFGLCGFPALYSFGTAVRHGRILLEFSATYHQYLGFTPNFSFQFDLK